MSIINEIFFIFCTRERGGAQRPHIAARANVFWRPFWPTHANHHGLADRAGLALLADAWRLAWVGQKCSQNQLIMVRFLCYGESGSSMFCGCGVAIVWYTRCRVQCPNNTKTWQINPPTGKGIKQPTVDSKHMWITRVNRRIFTCAQWGAVVRRRVSNLGGKLDNFVTLVSFSHT